MVQAPLTSPVHVHENRTGISGAICLCLFVQPARSQYTSVEVEGEHSCRKSSVNCFEAAHHEPAEVEGSRFTSFQPSRQQLVRTKQSRVEAHRVDSPSHTLWGWVGKPNIANAAFSRALRSQTASQIPAKMESHAPAK